MLREMTFEYVESLKYVNEVPRRFTLPDGMGDIIAVVGPRRVGKTFTLLKKAAAILGSGGKAVYVTFDDPELRRWSARKLAEEARALYPSGRVALFLDEVRDWPDWDRNLRWLHDVKDFEIYVSGSTSALSLDRVPSRLRGRYISKLLLPLSFAEVANATPDTFRGRGALKNLLDAYLKWGGFPEVWLGRSLDKIRALLDTVFYRDIVEGRGIREPEEFEVLFRAVVESYANPVTWRSLTRQLAAEGVEIDVKTVIRYVKYMQWSYLVFVVEPYGYRRSAPRKVYLVDTSLASLTKAGLDKGRKMENAVYIELLQRSLAEGGKVYYLKWNSGEVDFYYVGSGRAVIEVSYDPDEGHIRKAARAADRMRLGKAQVISWDLEDRRIVGGVEVELIPLWRWLLR